MGTRIEQTDLARDALYTKVNQIADEKVSLTGAETITGIKTFDSNIKFTNNAQSYRHFYSDNSAITKGTTPSSNTGTDYLFRDSANSNIGAVSMWYNTEGNINASLNVYTPTAGSTTAAVLKVSNYLSGRADVVFSTSTGVANSCLDGATNSTTSNMVALKGWVNNPATATNVVHRTGDEIIGGTKTFQNAWPVLNTTAVAYNETPSSNVYSGLVWSDKNGDTISNFYSALYSGGSGATHLYLRNKAGAESRISLCYSSNGTFYTEVPTPTENNTSSKQIDTVGARNTQINNKFKVVSSLPSTPDSNTFYFVTG